MIRPRPGGTSRRGLAFAQAHPRLRKPSLGVGVLSRQLAALAYNQGDFATADRVGLKAGQFFEAFLAQAGPRTSETVREAARRNAAEAFMIVARAQLAMARADDAEVALTRARAYARLAGAAEQEVDLLALAASVAQARKDHVQAIDLFQQATAGRRINRLGPLIAFQQGLARSQRALARYDDALASIQAAVALVEEVRSELQESNLRSGFLDDKQRLYQLAVTIALQAGQPAEAFGFAERGRARAFLDLLGGQTTLSKGKTRTLVQEEVRLRGRLAEARASAQEQEGGPAGDRVRAQLGDPGQHGPHPAVTAGLAAAAVGPQPHLARRRLPVDLLALDPARSALGDRAEPDPDRGHGGVELRGVRPGLLVITELKIGKGKLEVRAPGGEWRPAGPLQALRAGDEVRATDNAALVILMSAGRGTIRVDAKNSPFVVGPGQSDASKTQKVQALVSGSLGFLSATTKEPPTAVLSTRATARPPEVLTPRNGPALPDALAFEWLGSQFSRYTVRVLEPAEVVLERKGVVGAHFSYPADAPALKPGVRYRFQVEALGHPPYEAWFEIVAPARAAAVRQELRQLEDDLGPGVSPSSLAAVKAGALAAAGLLHDARLTVLAALARDPDEATLHLLLGNLYLRTGLPQLAAESLDEAQFLARGER